MKLNPYAGIVLLDRRICRIMLCHFGVEKTSIKKKTIKNLPTVQFKS